MAKPLYAHLGAGHRSGADDAEPTPPPVAANSPPPSANASRRPLLYGEKLVPWSVPMPQGLLARLGTKATDTGLSKAAIVRMACERILGRSQKAAVIPKALAKGTAVHVCLPPNTRKAIRALAKSRRQTISGIISEAVGAFTARPPAVGSDWAPGRRNIRVSYRLDEDIDKRTRFRALVDGRSVSSVVRDALDLYLRASDE